MKGIASPAFTPATRFSRKNFLADSASSHVAHSRAALPISMSSYSSNTPLSSSRVHTDISLTANNLFQVGAFRQRLQPIDDNFGPIVLLFGRRRSPFGNKSTSSSRLRCSGANSTFPARPFPPKHVDERSFLPPRLSAVIVLVVGHESIPAQPGLFCKKLDFWSISLQQRRARIRREASGAASVVQGDQSDLARCRRVSKGAGELLEAETWTVEKVLHAVVV